MSSVSGTVLAVEHDEVQTILRIATGSNGDKRQENVIVPGRHDTLVSGIAVRLFNFVRSESGELVPGADAKLKISPIAPQEPERAVVYAPENSSTSATSTTAITVAPRTQGLMAFSDKTTRHELFNRAVEVAREFAEHIRRSGQIMKIQGRDYVTVAGWSIMPAFESANCYTIAYQVGEDGSAYAEAVVEKNGEIVSRGFGACSDKERPKINDRLAMAQTRARGSALKARYSVLVTLAGYEPALADEVEDAVASAPISQQPVQQPPHSPEPEAFRRSTKKQVEFALQIFEGDVSELMRKATEHGSVARSVNEISVPILKKIVEEEVNARKRRRAEEAAGESA